VWVGAVVQNALATLPQVKAAELRLRGAQRGLRAARGQWGPSVLLFGNVGTTYSSAARRTVGSSSEIIPYGDQWQNNRFSTLGVGVQIPILNGLQTRTRVGLALFRLALRKILCSKW
jgi:outer membrane protein